MNRLERVFVVATAQQNILLEIGVASDKIVGLSDYVDSAFFDPEYLSGDLTESCSVGTYGDIGGLPNQFLLAVGQERRDYQTLVAAAKVVDIPLVIVPSSEWVGDGAQGGEKSGVLVVRRRLSWPQLRELYRRSLAVVVPIEPGTDYAAGVNGMLEGMSMAKPVFVSGTVGLADYIDPTCLGGIACPGDVDSLSFELSRLSDTYLLESRGAAARAKVLRDYTLDAYVRRISTELNIGSA